MKPSSIFSKTQHARCDAWLLPMLAALVVAPASAASPEKPNVVLNLIDDFGYECVTATGGESYRLQDAKRRRRSGG